MADEDLNETDALITEAHQGPYFVSWSADNQTAVISRTDGTNTIPVCQIAVDGNDPKARGTIYLMAHSWDLQVYSGELRNRRAQVTYWELLQNKNNPVVEAVLRIFEAYPNINLPGTIAAGFRTRFADLKARWQAFKDQV